MNHLWFLWLVFLMLSRQFIVALWSPAGKGLTSWLLLVMFIVFFITFPCGILMQVWYLIVSFPDLCRLSYFYENYATQATHMLHKILTHEKDIIHNTVYYEI